MCYEQQKMVIVATQMMTSMVTSIIPTRAEVTDVFNAVTQHVTAVMLSEETATSINPINVIITMKKIIFSAEKYLQINNNLTKVKMVDFI
jgi:pyruvate kinase